MTPAQTRMCMVAAGLSGILARVLRESDNELDPETRALAQHWVFVEYRAAYERMKLEQMETA